MSRSERVRVGPLGLDGALDIPDAPKGLVVFVHGSGSSRHSPRNVYVAQALLASGFATLLFDLLTESEGIDRTNVFDIPLLARRTCDALAWASARSSIGDLPIGLFGSSTGAAAAIVAAAHAPESVRAIVSRGGRPDLARAQIGRVEAPTLLIVGGADQGVLDLNREAYEALRSEARIDVIPGATHLFEEPGALDAVIDRARKWFEDHLSDRAPEDAA